MIPHDLTLSGNTSITLDDIHFSAENKKLLNQLLKEVKHSNALQEYDLPVTNKVLLYGHTGCGKTTTAKAIAKALNKKILILNLGNLVSFKLGETASNITALFKNAQKESAVLFLDEFDSIGKVRDYDNTDSGEMKRLVNTIIQLIDYLPKNVLLIAATNQFSIIDTALLRRFQLKLNFEAPTVEQLDKFYDSLLAKYPERFRTITRNYHISYAEAKDNLIHAVKMMVIAEQEEQ
jgi:SpoVK/Ycf46/Vps4 family AAA+-type ATPase